MFKFISVALVYAILISPRSKAQGKCLITNFNQIQQKSSLQDSDTAQCDMENCFCDDDLSPADVMISHAHTKGEWMVSYRYMQMHMQGLSKRNQAIEDKEVLNQYATAGENMNMKMYMLMLMYGINERLTVMGMFHYTSNYMEMIMKQVGSQHRHAMKTVGAGDTKLSALYALVKRERTQLYQSGQLISPNLYLIKSSGVEICY
jgi:hypothetical protein